nr:hypothetical protein [Deltaproteobacteria bacterium]
AARDEHGTVAQSHRVVTQRLLYCQELVGAGTQPAPDIAGAVEQLAAANITLVPLPRGAMPARPNLDVESGDGQRAAFITDLDQAFAASPGAAKAPHVLTVAYLDRVTVQHKIKVTVPNVEAGGAATVVEIRRGGEPRYLWMGIDQTPWLTAASFTPDSGPAQDIKAHCTAVPNDHHYPDQCRNVRIALGSLPAGRGTVELYLVTVRKILGGVSFGTQTQRICVATRAGWVDVDPAKQQALVLHEIGHKLGLVPDGSGSLDRSPLQYDHTHTGSHCHWRLAPAAAYGPYEMGRCVMFGEALAPNQAFCQTCCDAARKADLSMGWTHS